MKQKVLLLSVLLGMGIAPAISCAQTETSPLMGIAQSLACEGATVVKLDNGMTVIVKAVRTAPIVNVRCYVLAGSMTEGRWLGCGLSHILEHLVAKESIHE
ncbi:insulinase family protein, partial [Candidatus Pacearchaeota archaeon]|nr:insulinase family protein [Candidatus Pacearchaeota archaeon]